LLYKTDLIQQSCLFDDKLEIYEDWDFLIQVSLLGEFIHLKETTGIYRDTNSSGLRSDYEKTNFYRFMLMEKWKNKLSSEHYFNFLNYLLSFNPNEKEYNEIENELLKLKSQLNKSNAEIVQLTTSFSWRITKPIRWIKIKKQK